MRNRIRFALALPAFMVAGDLWCQTVVLGSALRDMNISLTLPQNVEMLPIVEQEDLEYQVAFRPRNAHYEVRISLFPQSSLVRHSGNGDIDRYLPLFSMGLLASVAKESLSFCKSADLPGPTVKKEFGADKGMTALVRGNRSDFGRGFAQIAVVFLYKAGKGAVVITFLYDESKDLQMDGLEFSQAYYCIRFNEGSAKQLPGILLLLEERPLAQLGECLAQLLLRVHDDRPVPRNGLAERPAGNQEEPDPCGSCLHRDLIS
jgi:hypothetical protein